LPLLLQVWSLSATMIVLDDTYLPYAPSQDALPTD